MIRMEGSHGEYEGGTNGCNDDTDECSRKLLKHADAKLKQAHQAQTQMLTYEARGQNVDVTLLMVHSQDHLISAMTIRRLADDIIDLYQQVHAQK